jgi:Putative zinc-finger
MKMTCERVNTLLTLYVDEGLPARDAGRVAGHLARCAACRAELQSLERTLAVLDRVRPQAPPIDLWEQFRSRLEAERVTSQAERRIHGADAGRAARGVIRLQIPFRSFAGGCRWRAALAAPAAVLAAALVALAGFAIGIGSGGPHGETPMTLPRVHGPVAPLRSVRAPVERTGPRPGQALSARSTRRGSDLARLPLIAPITPPETRLPVSFEVRGHAVGRASASRGPAAATPVRAAENDRAASRTAAAFGQYPSVAPPSADVAEALQSSVEETTRQRVADEVALLAQELNRAEAHTADFFGPSGPREPS